MIIEQMRTVLLVSDQCWQDILSLVPIAIQPERWLPVLIYHQEGNTIDVDATLHFLRRYLLAKDGEPSNAAVVHVGVPSPQVQRTLVPLLTDQCQIARNQIWGVNHMWTLQSYYPEVKTWVVVARDDYESGLVAAPFAALLRAHLCFLDSETLEAYKPLVHNLRMVYLVGQLDEQISNFFGSLNHVQIHQVTSRDIQKKYLEQVQTDKIILVNPRDFDLHYEESNEALLEQTSGEIRYIYGKCSLVAPFLAAAKQEIIIPIPSTDPTEIDDSLNQAIAELKLEPRYLTIVASPEAIPMSDPEDADRELERVEIDGRRYGSTPEDWQDMDLAVGRIFGITVSDCSAYVARLLFFAKLARPKEPQALLVLLLVNRVKVNKDGFRKIETVRSRGALEKHLEDHYWTEEVQKSFDRAWPVYGRNESLGKGKKKTVERRYPEASLILYSGHGSYDGFGVEPMKTSKLVQNKTYLDGFPVILGVACLTGAYEWVKIRRQAADIPDDQKPKLAYLFVAQNIRRGAMAQQCSVSISYWHNELHDLLTALYVEGHSVGEAIRLAKNSERCLFNRKGLDNFTDYTFDGDPHYLLVGDPTFVPKDYMS